MDEIIAREKQLETLGYLYGLKQPELIALYGRRRVGKTFLVTRFFRSKGLFFNITGVKGASLVAQLQNFAATFSDLFLKGAPLVSPKNWHEAFDLLRKQIQQTRGDKRIILSSAPKNPVLQGRDVRRNSSLA